VKAHGGDLHLQDSSEEGACFVVSIPDHVTQLRTPRSGERQTL
jgi:signal transduction histidine kinase